MPRNIWLLILALNYTILNALLLFETVILVVISDILVNKHALCHCGGIVPVGLGLSQVGLLFYFCKFIVFFVHEHFHKFI